MVSPIKKTWAVLGGLLLCACGEVFKPESLVEGLRVLGISAEPAELAPGESTQLSSLMVDQSQPSGRPSVLWMACDPDPYGQNRSVCADSDAVGSLGSSDGGFSVDRLPEGLHFIGLNEQAAYRAPATLFDALDSADPRRRQGSVATVLAFAVGESLPLGAPPEALQALWQRVQSRTTPSLLTLFRVLVREGSAANRNPSIERVLWRGVALAEGEVAVAVAGETVPLAVEASDDSFEPFEKEDAAGQPVPQTERLVASWYSTTGRFKEPRWALGSEVENAFEAPSEGHATNTLPAQNEGKIWVVLRDSRGGQAWREIPFQLTEGGP